MIFRWFFWRCIKLSFLISFLFTFLFFVVQIIKLDQIIFNLPLEESLPFIFLWFFYYFSYMLPVSFLIAYSINLFELKESKKLYNIQSFGVDPKSFYTKTLFLASPVLLALLFSFLTLKEDDISHIRKQLTVKYYANIITSLPQKSFQNFEQFTLYVEKREGNILEGIFFKFQEGVVIARKAKVEKEDILFEGGSLLTDREGKTFSTDFNTYRLSLGAVVEKRKEPQSKKLLVGILNLSLLPILMGFVYPLMRFIDHHHRFYYAIGVLSLLYQIALILFRHRL